MLVASLLAPLQRPTVFLPQPRYAVLLMHFFTHCSTFYRPSTMGECDAWSIYYTCLRPFIWTAATRLAAPLQTVTRLHVPTVTRLHVPMLIQLDNGNETGWHHPTHSDLVGYPADNINRSSADSHFVEFPLCQCISDSISAQYSAFLIVATVLPSTAST